jgi:hypothetical protein
MGPGGLPSLQNCVSGGAPLTGGFDSHAPSPSNARSDAKNAENGSFELRSPRPQSVLPQSLPSKTPAKRYVVGLKDGVQRRGYLIALRRQ